MEQQRHVRKLNGRMSPDIPVMAHPLMSKQVAYLSQHVQALDETEDLMKSCKSDAPLASAWYCA
jgi:selenophosphate synthetase-related protein